MRLIEREWTSGTYTGLCYAYADVEPALLEFEKGIRVLPARYYYEKQLNFALVARYEPGEHKTMPNGGFHCRNASGANYWFDLDQVVVHPSIISMRKKKVKWDLKMERQQETNAKAARRIERLKRKELEADKPKRGRGRPALDPEAKKLRDENAVKRATTSGGKRGRPKLEDGQRKNTTYKPKGGKRGRPALDPTKVEQRKKELALKLAANPERKRGRPALDPEAAKRKAEDKAQRALISGGRRGRPRKLV